MGCDIHIQVEMQIDDDWQIVPGPIVDCYCCHGTALDSQGEMACYFCTENDGPFDPYFVGPGKIHTQWFGDRNYDLFAYLADVRNYDNVTPLEYHEGYPQDRSLDVEVWYANSGGRSEDAHSHAWIEFHKLVQFLGTIASRDDNLGHVKCEAMDLCSITGEHPVRLIYWFDN